MANFLNNRTHLPASMYIGLCLPSICQPDQIQNVMNNKLVDANPMIQAVLGFPVSVGSVDVNPQDTVYPINGWFYVAIIVLVLLFLMGVFAVVKKRMEGKK